MSNKKRFAAIFFCLLCSAEQVALAATYWVGSSAACTGPNVHGSVDGALLAAALTPDDDEIRLTATVGHTSSLIVDLSDWHPGALGRLTLAGGYADCFSGQSGRTVLGGVGTGNLITVSFSSEVTLENLELTATNGRALEATQGADVTLNDVWIHDNLSGISVMQAASVSIDESTVIEDNDSVVNAFGGGIDCLGGSYVGISGRLSRNYADSGGNISVVNCTVELFGGAVIEGFDTFNTDPSAVDGGGIYVSTGGTLLGSGGSSRVTIRNHHASQSGGGLYITGTGVAELHNTLFYNNSASMEGGAIHARNGGLSAPQITMDRVGDCPFSFSCSEIERSRLDNTAEGVAIFATNSVLEISRTVFDLNGVSFAFSENELVTTTNGAQVYLDSVGISRNDVTRLFRLRGGSSMQGAHITTSLNSYTGESGTASPWAVVLEGASDLDIRNSILNETTGISSIDGSTVAASCNLVDTTVGLPPGSFFIGTAEFIDAPGGGIIQTPTSLGVDMCNDDGFAHTTTTDITFQSRPVDEATNANGFPGISGGIFDAGMNEVHDMIFTGIFSDGFETGDTAVWPSVVQ